MKIKISTSRNKSTSNAQKKSTNTMKTERQSFHNSDQIEHDLVDHFNADDELIDLDDFDDDIFLQDLNKKGTTQSDMPPSKKAKISESKSKKPIQKKSNKDNIHQVDAIMIPESDFDDEFLDFELPTSSKTKQQQNQESTVKSHTINKKDSKKYFENIDIDIPDEQFECDLDDDDFEDICKEEVKGEL